MGGKIQGSLLDLVGFGCEGPLSMGFRVADTALLTLFETPHKLSPLRSVWTHRLKSPAVTLH